MNIAIFVQNRPHFGATMTHLPLILSLLQIQNVKIFLFSKNSSSKMVTSIFPQLNILVHKNRFKELLAYKQTNADITISLRKNSSFLTFFIAVLNKNKKIGFKNSLCSIGFTHCIQYNTTIYRADNFLNTLPNDISKRYFSKTKQKHFCIIPAGEHHKKHWSIENYINLAILLHTNYPNFPIYFILGEAEKTYIEKIENASQKFHLLVAKPLTTLFEIIQSASCVIGNDCGPMHIAQISDTTNVVLFTNIDGKAGKCIQEWFRVKSNAVALSGQENHSIDSITVESVFSTVTDLISKELA